MKAIAFRVWVASFLAGVFAYFAVPVCAQLTPSEEERLQILTDPEAIAKKIAKDKNRPPFEFFRSQVAPFDVLPLREGESLVHGAVRAEGQRRRLRRRSADRSGRCWWACRRRYITAARLGF